MINFEQVKELTIFGISGWVMEVEGNLDNIQNIVSKLNSCKTMDDLVHFYIDRGYSSKEAYETILTNLMTLGKF